MTLDPKKNKKVKKTPVMNKSKPKTNLTKENYEKLKRLTGSGFVSIHKK